MHFKIRKGIRKLVGNISFILLLNLLVKPVGLVVENLVQNRIGHEAYGLFSALFAIAAIGAVLSDMGISQLVTKKIAADPNFFITGFPNAFPIKFFLSLAFPVIISGIGFVLGYDWKILYLLLIIAVGFALTQFILFFRATMQGNQNFNLDAVGSVTDKFLLVLFVLALLPFGLNLENYIYARTVAAAIAFGVLYFMVSKLYGRLRLKIDKSEIKNLLKESLPFAMIMLVYGINERVDIVMLERLSSAKEAGLYAAPYRWVDAIMMFLWTILPIFFAKFALTIQNKKDQEKLLHFGQMVIAVPIIFICVFSFFYGNIFFFQFVNSTTSEIEMLVSNLQILFVNVLVHGFFAIYSTLLTSSNFEKPVSRLVAISIFLNIGLNFVFIPEYGSLAAAYNTLLCAVFVSVGYFILVGRKVQIKLPLILLAKLAVITLLLIGVFYGIRFFSGAWLLNTFVAGFAYAGLLFALRIVSLAQLRQLITKK